MGHTYRWPPLSSVKLCFQTLPSWTLISKPSIKSWLSGGCSFAKFPGRSSAKMPPKSLGNKSQISVRGAMRKLTRSPSPMSSSRRPSCTGLVPRSSARSFPYLSVRSRAFLSSSPRASRRWSIVRVSVLRHQQRTSRARTYRSCSSPSGSPFSSCPAAAPRARAPCPSTVRYQGC